jgi:uncharacterized delta-60 repeat protein
MRHYLKIITLLALFTLELFAGTLSVIGSSDDDFITAPTKASNIYGLDGSDTIYGSDGDDVIRGDSDSQILTSKLNIQSLDLNTHNVIAVHITRLDHDENNVTITGLHSGDNNITLPTAVDANISISFEVSSDNGLETWYVDFANNEINQTTNGGSNFILDMMSVSQARIYIDAINFNWAYPLAGSLNDTYGTSGQALHDGGSDLIFSQFVQDSAGDTIAVGSKVNGSDKGIYITKYNLAGNLDSSFGASGIRYFDEVGTHIATDVAIDHNGKIVVTAISDNIAKILRFNPDGSPDLSFDSDGNMSIDLGGISTNLESVLIDENNNIIVGGTYEATSGNTEFLIGRYLDSGAPDLSFGGDGNVTIDVGSSQSAFIHKIAFHGTDKILAVGHNSSGFAVASVFNDGTQDFSNEQAIATSAIANDVIVQDDGKFVVIGENASTNSIIMARFTDTGELDTTFASSGILNENPNPLSSMTLAQTAISLDDGSFFVAGESDSKFLLAKYTKDGALSLDFNTTGFTEIDLSPIDPETVMDMELLANGNLFLGGVGLDTTLKFVFAQINQHSLAAPEKGKLYAYVNDNVNDTVDVVEVDTGTVVDRIVVGDEPRFVQTSRDHKYVFVSNYAGNSVSVIDTETNTVIDTIAGIASPSWSVQSRDWTTLYVQSATQDIYEVDLSNYTVTTTGTGFCTGKSIYSLDISADDSKLYAPCLLDNSTNSPVDIINTSNGSLKGSITTGNTLHEATLSGDGKYLYVQERKDNPTTDTYIALYKIDTFTDTVISELNVTKSTNNWEIELSHDDKIAYIANGTELLIYNLESNDDIKKTLPNGANSEILRLSDDNKKLYLTIYNSSDILEYDLLGDSFRVLDVGVNAITSHTYSAFAYSGGAESKLKIAAHGGALQFDGTNYLESQNSFSFGSHTIEAWVDINGSDEIGIISSQNGTNYFSMTMDALGQLNVEVTSSPNSKIYTATSGEISNGWHHIAYSLDVEHDVLSLYIDGRKQLITFSLDDSISGFNFSDKLIFGAKSGLDFLMDGGLDEVRIWKRARTAEEILLNYQHQLKGDESDLLAYYHFDERMGDDIINSVTGQTDYTLGVSGQQRLNHLGSTFSFRNVDDNITLPHNVAYNFDTNDDFTLGFWLKTEHFGSEETFINKAISPVVAPFRVDILASGNVRVSRDDGTNNPLISGSSYVNDNLYHYIAFVKEGNELSLYVDGVFDGNTTDSTTLTTVNSSDIYVGHGLAKPISISHFSIFDRALTLSEIQNSQNNLLLGNETGLVGYWPLNEGSGDIVYDYSSTGANGTVEKANVSTHGDWNISSPTLIGDTIYTTSGIHSHEKIIPLNIPRGLSYTQQPIDAKVSNLSSALGTFTYTGSQSSFHSIMFNEPTLEINSTINIRSTAVPYLYINGLDINKYNIVDIRIKDPSNNTLLTLSNIPSGSSSYGLGSIPRANHYVVFGIDTDSDNIADQEWYYNMQNGTALPKGNLASNSSEYQHDFTTDLVINFSSTILKTGQTLSYDNAGGLDPSIHDDGYYQAGSTQVLLKNGDVVEDNITGLMWEDSIAPIPVSDFNAAFDRCDFLSLNGYEDWRLPSVMEFNTIIDHNDTSMVGYNKVFVNRGSTNSWTSDISETANAWSYAPAVGTTFKYVQTNSTLYSGKCVRGLPLERPSFTRDGSNEVVVEHSSALMWQDNVEVSTTDYEWTSAINHCENLVHGNYNDWRMPNINELITLFDPAESNYINATFTHRTASATWASTSKDSARTNAMVMSIGAFTKVSKSNLNKVRCVRAGQSNTVNFHALIDTNLSNQNVTNIQALSTDGNYTSLLGGQSISDGNLSLDFSLLSSFTAYRIVVTIDGVDYYYNKSDGKLYELNGSDANFAYTSAFDPSINIQTETENIQGESRIFLDAHGGVLQIGKSGYVTSTTINTSTHTVEFWFNSNDSDGGTILELVDNSTSVKVELTDDANLSITFFNEVDTGVLTSSSVALDDGAWHHIAFIYDSGSSALYLDGVSNSIVSGTMPSSMDLSNSSLSLGSITTAQNSNFLIDEVRIWGFARSQTEISKEMKYQTNVMQTGLVANYSFDERIGQVLVDQTSNGHEMLISGDVERLNFLGDNMVFDGNMSRNLYHIPHPQFDVFHDLTMMAWVNLDNNSTNQNIIDNFASNNGYSLGMINANVKAELGNAGVSESITSITKLQIGKWYHLTAQYDLEKAELRLYINGKLDNSSAIGPLNNSHNTQVFYLGRDDSGSNTFSGKLAEVSIFDKALLAAEINQYMHSSVDPERTDLIAYWSLDNNYSNDVSTNFLHLNKSNTIVKRAAPTIYGNTIITSEGLYNRYQFGVQNPSAKPLFNYTNIPQVVGGNDGNVTYYASHDSNFTVRDSVSSTELNVSVFTIDTNILQINGFDDAKMVLTSFEIRNQNGRVEQNLSLPGYGSTRYPIFVNPSDSYYLTMVTANNTWVYNFDENYFVPLGSTVGGFLSSFDKPITINFSSPLRSTGQTISYDENGSVKASMRDDGFYTTGVIPLFERNKSTFIVDDVMNGLQWKDDIFTSVITQDNALEYCETSTIGGFADWRLPSIEELHTLIDFSKDSGSKVNSVFENIDANIYWSRTYFDNNASKAWQVDFGTSAGINLYDEREISESKRVTCVRGREVTPSYFINAGNIVYDETNNLAWQDESIVASQTLSWLDAINYCENLTLDSLKWRLPNISELASLAVMQKNSPSIDSNFTNTANATYWSSTTPGEETTSSYGVQFTDGKVVNDAKSILQSIRCVSGPGEKTLGFNAITDVNSSQAVIGDITAISQSGQRYTLVEGSDVIDGVVSLDFSELQLGAFYTIEVIADGTRYYYNKIDGRLYPVDDGSFDFDVIIVLNDEFTINMSKTFKSNVLGTVIHGSGSVIQLDANDSAIVIPLSTVLSTLDSEFTIEMWFKRDRNSTQKQVLITDSNSTDLGFEVYLDANADKKLHFDIYDNGGSLIAPFSSFTNIDNSWHHLAVVQDGSFMDIYIDGVSSGGTSASAIKDMQQNLYIGGVSNGDDDNLTFPFIGLVDELRIWGDVRTSTEIADNYQLQLKGDEDNLSALYHFDERIGYQFFDSSIHNNSAYVQGKNSIPRRINFLGAYPEFNGATSITIPHDSSYDVSDAMSLSFWLKYGGNQNEELISKYIMPTSGSGFKVSTVGGKVQIDLVSTSDAMHHIYSQKSDLNNSQWHHIAFTFDNGNMELIIDGNDDNKTETAPFSIATNSNSIDISNGSFIGTIRDFAFYNRPISAFKAHGLSIQSPYTDEDGLLGFWPMDDNYTTIEDGLLGFWPMDDNYTTIQDLTVNANHATFNAPTWNSGDIDMNSSTLFTAKGIHTSFDIISVVDTNNTINKSNGGSTFLYSDTNSSGYYDANSSDGNFTINVTTNTLDELHTFGVKAYSIGTLLEHNHNVVSFGAVQKASNSTTSLGLKAIIGDVQINSISLEDNTGAFTLGANDCSGSLLNDTHCEINVSFSPQYHGYQSALLRVESDNYFENNQTFLVYGLGRGFKKVSTTRSDPIAGTHTLLLSDVGVLYATGANNSGQLGNGTNIDSNVTIEINSSANLIDIVAGNKFSLGLDSLGDVYSWGDNTDGQLGINSTTVEDRLQKMQAIDTPIEQIFTTHASSFALDVYGRVWVVGENAEGERADANTTDALLPFVIDTLPPMAMIATGRRHILGLGMDGKVYAWGENGDGQIGDGTIVDATTPVVHELKDIVSVITGNENSFALRSDGRYYAWGLNTDGQLGMGDTSVYNVPTLSPETLNITKLSAGENFTVAMTNDGKIHSVGSNTNKELGVSGSPDVSSFIQIASSTNWIDISAGHEDAFAIDSNEDSYVWGNNGDGALGLGTTLFADIPTYVQTSAGLFLSESVINYKIGALGSEANVTIDLNNTISGSLNVISINLDSPEFNQTNTCVGAIASNSSCQITLSFNPKTVGLHHAKLQVNSDDVFDQNITMHLVGRGYLADVPLIYADINRSFASGKHQHLFGWGEMDGANGFVSPDYNATNDVNYTARIAKIGLTDIVDMDSGLNHTVLLDKDGDVWTFGTDVNDVGLLGQGNDSNSSTALQISNLHGIIEVAVGNETSYALDENGSVWAWGVNDKNQTGMLGGSFKTPTKIPGLFSILHIDAGHNFAIAIDDIGDVYSWGKSVNGELGTGAIALQHPDEKPTRITQFATILKISVGNTHVLALDKDGDIWAWGSNSNLELGRSGAADGLPTLMSSFGNVVDIEADYLSSFAILDDGTLRSWGSKLRGALGNGISSGSTQTPFTVPVNKIKAVSANYHHVLAVDENGTIHAWGANDAYQVEGLHNSDYLEPFETLFGVPEIETSATNLSFDVATAGVTQNQQVNIYNSGSGDLNISTIIVNNGGGTLSGTTSCNVLQSENNCSLFIEYTSSDLNSDSGTFRILSTDNNESNITVNILANIHTLEQNSSYSQSMPSNHLTMFDSGNKALVISGSGIDKNLTIFDTSTPSIPVMLDTIELNSTNIGDVLIRSGENKVLVIGEYLEEINITNPSTITKTDINSTGASIDSRGALFNNNLVFSAASELWMYNLSNEGNFTLDNNTTLINSDGEMAVNAQGTILYIAQDANITEYNISNPSSLIKEGSFTTNAVSISDVQQVNNKLFVNAKYGDGHHEIVIYDISDPSSIVNDGNYTLDSSAKMDGNGTMVVAENTNFVYLSVKRGLISSLEVIDVSDTSAPYLYNSYTLNDDVSETNSYSHITVLGDSTKVLIQRIQSGNTVSSGYEVIHFIDSSLTVPSPSLSVSTTSIDFGSLKNTLSTSQTFTLTSTGEANNSLTGVNLSFSNSNTDDYTITHNCPTPLAGGESCSATVEAKVTTNSGVRTGQITISNNVSPRFVNLTANRTPETKVMSVTPTSINFRSLPLETHTDSQDINVTNIGEQALTILSVNLSGNDFNISESNCTNNLSLAVGEVCQVKVQAVPLNIGRRSGTITVLSDADTNPSVEVDLIASATPALFARLDITPANFDFGLDELERTQLQEFVLSNSGTELLTLGSISSSNTDDFTLSDSCGASLGIAQSCTIGVTLLASDVEGNISTTISIESSDFNTTTKTIDIKALRGEALINVSSSEIVFDTVKVGLSDNKTLTINNSGFDTLIFSSFAITSESNSSAIFIENDNCGTSLEGKSSCTLDLRFEPIVEGNSSANLEILSSDDNNHSSVIVKLFGEALPAIIKKTVSISILEARQDDLEIELFIEKADEKLAQTSLFIAAGSLEGNASFELDDSLNGFVVGYRIVGTGEDDLLEVSGYLGEDSFVGNIDNAVNFKDVANFSLSGLVLVEKESAQVNISATSSSAISGEIIFENKSSRNRIYKNFNIPASLGSTSIKVVIPQNGEYVVSYYIDGVSGVVQTGYVTSLGMSAYEDEAARFSFSTLLSSTQNVSLLKGITLSGTITTSEALSDSTRVAVRAVPSSVSATTFFGHNVIHKLNIPSGATSVPYTMTIPDAGFYKVSYVLREDNGTNYINEGFYSDGLTTAYKNRASYVDVNSDVTGINLALKSGISISGSVTSSLGLDTRVVVTAELDDGTIFHEDIEFINGTTQSYSINIPQEKNAGGFVVGYFLDKNSEGSIPRGFYSSAQTTASRVDATRVQASSSSVSGIDMQLLSIKPATITLLSGWNLVSLPAVSSLSIMDLYFTFGDKEDIDYLLKQDRIGESYYFVGESNEFLDRFSTLTHEEGFWIKTRAAMNLSLPIDPSSTDTTVPTVYRGWNLVGVASEITPSEIISQVSARNQNVLTIWTYDESTSPKWSAFNATDSNSSIADTNAITTIQADQGIWMKVE